MIMTLGLSQMNSDDDKQAHLQAAEKSIKQFAAQGAQLILLPEHFNYLESGKLKRKNAFPPWDNRQALTKSVTWPLK